MKILKDLIQRYAAQKDRIHRLSREAGWIVAGQAASVLGSLVLVRVLTEYLEPAEYGQLALGLTVATLVNQVVMGGLIAGIGRFYSIATEKGDLRGYLRAARRMLIIATAVVVGLGMILIGTLVAVEMHHWLWLATAALVFSILSSYNGALNGIQNAARQRAIVALHGGMDAWLKIGLAVGVMLWLGTNSAAVVVGYTLPGVIVKDFMQPDKLVNEIADAGCFILPSRGEPWGVVVHEFAAAGMPLILSDAVGAASTFLVPGLNGYSFRTNDAAALAERMEQIIDSSDDELLAMSVASHRLSERTTPHTSAANLLSILDRKRHD